MMSVSLDPEFNLFLWMTRASSGMYLPPYDSPNMKKSLQHGKYDKLNVCNYED